MFKKVSMCSIQEMTGCVAVFAVSLSVGNPTGVIEIPTSTLLRNKKAQPPVSIVKNNPRTILKLSIVTEAVLYHRTYCVPEASRLRVHAGGTGESPAMKKNFEAKSRNVP